MVPGISRVIYGTKAKNQQIFRILKYGLGYLCAIALFQQLVEICQIAATLSISFILTTTLLLRSEGTEQKLKFCFSANLPCE